ncbi:plasmid partitioning protein RepB C-terminal domain-containing protein [Asticcacaulis endophyticus]|uniref:Chromosome partitioning protein ParB n=1 Tax=Asticcacaulis endophyticus TaxID=1395890 RepID=A0A918QAN0_9CAUL|nr:plasmid partitioning protein RepB C-terminal domain-containing protein [Asticcacaulis endophyticus]GGZ39293.1 chromosome partitioning protein ParB [Asticcacaulis endophyticus]
MVSKRSGVLRLPQVPIEASFDERTVDIDIDQIIMTKVMDPKVFKSHKYKQIVASTRAVGIIEPPAVSLAVGMNGRYFLRDGHLRLHALKELGERIVTCLVASDDESFTYNKHINRIASIQEHKMIRRAIERGVSEEKLAEALNLDVRRIIEKRDMLEGICPEAIELLKDQFIAPKTFPVLRKMKPLRQVEAATLMNDAGIYTKPYVMALLAATPKAQLVHPERAKKIKGLDEDQMVRMETEMDSLQREYRLIEDSYGKDVLNLTLAKGYLGTLLNNARIVRYLSNHQPEILSQFRQISDMTKLTN